ncbi:alpha/beta hydrolase [Candidatus Parcubacteria bacterium]|nr:alpha/beta hydrolase [Candidatus Parcubacteria bacterium]
MKLIVNNLAINYFDEGRGPAVVLLHGWGQTLGTFDLLAAELHRHYRVIRLDLPGFGGSQRPAAVWGVQQYAELVRDFLAKLEIRPLALVGHSFGGRLAIKGVGQGLLRPERLVLMGSAGVAQFHTLRNQLFRMAAKLGKAVTSLPYVSILRGPLRRRLYRAAGSTDYLSAGAMSNIFLKVIHEDLQDDAGRINVPTLLIWGENDVDTPIKEARLFAGQIKGSRLEVLPEANHFVYLDQPDRVAGLVGEFLK